MLIFDKHYEQACELPREDKALFLCLLTDYIYSGIEPTDEELAQMPFYVRALWIGAKEDIDSFSKKSEIGKKGGRPKTRTKPKQNLGYNQNETEVITETKPTLSNGYNLNETEVITETKPSPNKSKSKDIKESIPLAGDTKEKETTTPAHSFFDSPYLANPPTVEEIRVYAETNLINADAQAFHDHYSAQGWIAGNGVPIRDWKAAFRRWAGNEWQHRRPKEGEINDALASIEFL